MPPRVGLPDQTLRAAGVIAGRLRALGTAQALECAGVFDALQRIEDGFSRADAEQRTHLLAELRGLVHRFVDLTGSPSPAKEAMRAAIYEDVGTRAHGASWRPDLLEANRDHFALFQRIVPVIDNATIEKLGLYSFFARSYGEHAEVPFTELYRAFADLEPERASEVMCGVGDAESDRVRDLRARFFALLRDAPTEDDETRLDPRRLREFADALPATVTPWRSAAYRVQIADGRLAVVNGVTTGHGVFFSRYCDMFDQDGGWSLSERLREHVAATAPRQTDITAALGLNFNLHPRLTPFELVYPGSVTREGARGVLTLADLVVRADPSTRRLHLVSRVDGQPVELVPMNFLHPIAAPMLYRFLCAFAPTRTYRGGLWDQVDRAEGTGHSTHPRVLLGDLVLDRRSWRFAADELPGLAGLEQQDLSALAEFDRWRRDRGVPRQGFFRVVAPQRGPGADRDFFAETRQWAVEARSARLHKPHFYDARNPFLMHVLAKQARATPGGSVVLHECLPEAAEYGGSGRAEEYFIEFTLGGGRGE
ncbi:lantibiotic dehydratase [Actinokineospora soli]|uniref:Lantibiotic dehydratase n=1 Tax=Actinokineospora soli TaxID=1048753 RepID=A0ABW2TMK4_9PSEU